MLTQCPHCGARLKSLKPRCDACGADLASDLVRPEFRAATTSSYDYDGTPHPGHAEKPAYQVSSPSGHLTDGPSSSDHSTIPSSTRSGFLRFRKGEDGIWREDSTIPSSTRLGFLRVIDRLLSSNSLIEGATWPSVLFNVAFFSAICIPLISLFLIGGAWYIGMPLAMIFAGVAFLMVRPAILRSTVLRQGRQTWGTIRDITRLSDGVEGYGKVSGYEYHYEFEVIREGQRPVTMVCSSTRLRSCQVGDRVLVRYLESDPRIAIPLAPPKQS